MTAELTRLCGSNDPKHPLAVRASGVLGEAAANALFAATLAEARWFVDASTGGRDGHRRAQLLYTPVDEAADVRDWMRERHDDICAALGMKVFTPTGDELQITAHRDGDFYRSHCDDQGEEVARRALSFLYYFHDQPCGFEGGELVIRGPGAEDRAQITISPTHDTLVVFDSSLEHEVLPVRISPPTEDVADAFGLRSARFTVNGWLWR